MSRKSAFIRARTEPEVKERAEAAIEDARAGRDLIEADSAEELFELLDEE